MAWDSNHPGTYDRLGEVPAYTRANFEALSAVIEREHYGFSSASSGLHIPGKVSAVLTTASSVISLLTPPSGSTYTTTDSGAMWIYWDDMFQAVGQDEWCRVRAYLGTAIQLSGVTSPTELSGSEQTRQVIFGSEDYDTLSAYNVSTGKFVPLTSSMYYFGVCVSMTGASASHHRFMESDPMTGKIWVDTTGFGGSCEWRQNGALTPKTNTPQYPSADGAIQWGNSDDSGSDNYSYVGHAVESPVVHYVYTASQGSKDYYHIVDPVSAAAHVLPVSGVRISISSRSVGGDNDTIKVGLILSGGDSTHTYWGDEKILDTTYTSYNTDWDTNPETSAAWDSISLLRIQGIALCASYIAGGHSIRVARAILNYRGFYGQHNCDVLSDGDSSTCIWCSYAKMGEEATDYYYLSPNSLPVSSSFISKITITLCGMVSDASLDPQIYLYSGTTPLTSSHKHLDVSDWNDTTPMSSSVTFTYRKGSTYWTPNQISNYGSPSWPLCAIVLYSGTLESGQGLSATGMSIQVGSYPPPAYDKVELCVLSADGVTIKRYPFKENPYWSDSATAGNVSSDHYSTRLQLIIPMCSADSAVVCASKYGEGDTIEAGSNRTYMVIHRMGEPCF